MFNIDCDMCSQGAYKIYKSQCTRKCPSPYIEDDSNRICSFDTNLLSKPVPPEDPKGCMDGYYWDWSKQNCSQCAYACLTCEFDQNYCTSCPNGRYLTSDSKCSLCETFWKDDMLVGSSGACLETCGDGQNFGQNMCDDGNTEDGDGCSSNCVTEKDYECSGGYPYSEDRCRYVPTEILEVKVTRNNDLILKFSRPIDLKNKSEGLTERDMVIMYRNQFGVH